MLILQPVPKEVQFKQYWVSSMSTTGLEIGEPTIGEFFKQLNLDSLVGYISVETSNYEIYLRPFVPDKNTVTQHFACFENIPNTVFALCKDVILHEEKDIEKLLELVCSYIPARNQPAWFLRYVEFLKKYNYLLQYNVYSIVLGLIECGAVQLELHTNVLASKVYVKEINHCAGLLNFLSLISQAKAIL